MIQNKRGNIDSHWENIHSFIRNGEENKASDTDVFVIIFQCSLSQNTCLQKAFTDVHNFLQCYVTGQSVQKHVDSKILKMSFECATSNKNIRHIQVY